MKKIAKVVGDSTSRITKTRLKTSHLQCRIVESSSKASHGNQNEHGEHVLSNMLQNNSRTHTARTVRAIFLGS